MNDNDKSSLLEQFIKYISAIYNFEKEFNKIKSESNNNKPYEGYLINSKDYEELKQNLNYDKCLKYNGSYELKDRKELIKNIDEKFYKIKKINQIEFKTNRYLVNMLLNNNKYVIINKALWKEIGDINNKDNNSIIKYSIESNCISFSFEKEKKLFFKPFIKNVIDKNAYNFAKPKNDYQSNYSEIGEILKNIKTYFEFETEFKEKLKTKKRMSIEYYFKEGYLISKKSLDDWKNYTNYDSIKKGLKKKKAEQDLLNELIYYKETNNIELKPLEVYYFNTKEEYECLENESLAIIDINLKDLFKIDDKNNYITKYYLTENKIYFNINEKEYLDYNAYSNNIFSNANFNLIHLKQLIKLFYFQEQLNILINSPQNIIDNVKNDLYTIYIVNKQMLDKYKQFFDYGTLYNYLKKNKNKEMLKNIDNDDNFNNNIIKKINKFDKNYIDNIKKKEISKELKIDSKDCDFEIKKFKVKRSYEEKNLTYINDIGIINEDILLFFLDNNLIQNGQQYYEGNFIA